MSQINTDTGLNPFANGGEPETHVDSIAESIVAALPDPETENNDPKDVLSALAKVAGGIIADAYDTKEKQEEALKHFQEQIKAAYDDEDSFVSMPKSILGPDAN